MQLKVNALGLNRLNTLVKQVKDFLIALLYRKTVKFRLIGLDDRGNLQSFLVLVHCILGRNRIITDNSGNSTHVQVFHGKADLVIGFRFHTFNSLDGKITGGANLGANFFPFQVGKSNLDINLTSDMTVEDPLNPGQEVDLGTANIEVQGESNPSPGRIRAFGGVQLNLWRIKLFLQANARPEPAAVGLTFGGRFAW